MSRPEMKPGTVGDRWTCTPLANGDVSVRGRGRLRDRLQADPVTGEFAAGPRVELTVRVSAADATDPRRVTAALTSALLERELAELAKATAKVETDIGPTWTLARLATDALAATEAGGTIRPTTLAVYRSHLNAHLNGSELGAMPYGTVRPAHVKAYLLTLAGTVGIASAKQGRAVVNRALQHAVDLGHMDRNPVRDVGVIRRADVLAVDDETGETEGRDHRRSLTSAERADLIAKVTADQRAQDLDLADLVVAGLSIGGRIGEVVGLRWADVTFTERGAEVAIRSTVTRVKGEGLRRTATKTKASRRVVPVKAATADLLRLRAERAGVDLDNLTADTRPVFPAPGRWAAPGESAALRDVSNTTKDLRKLFDRCGFPWLVFHSLRRTVVTTLADLGMLREASQLIGHTNTRTTSERYVGTDGKLADSIADYL